MRVAEGGGFHSARKISMKGLGRTQPHVYSFTVDTVLPAAISVVYSVQHLQVQRYFDVKR